MSICLYIYIFIHIIHIYYIFLFNFFLFLTSISLICSFPQQRTYKILHFLHYSTLFACKTCGNITNRLVRLTHHCPNTHIYMLFIFLCETCDNFTNCLMHLLVSSANSVDTRRRFNVYETSIRHRRRRIDVL